MVEGGMKCIKYLLFCFNLVFVVAGIGLIAIGAYVKIKMDEYSDFFGSEYLGPGRLLIGVGVIIFIIAFFGCCGAYKENYCLTMAFGVLLGAVFLMELGGGIAGYVMRNDIEDGIDRHLKRAQENYLKDSGDHDAWDNLQEKFDCCGLYNASEWIPVTGIFPPESCCSDSIVGNCTYVQAYDKGCRDSIKDYLKDNAGIIGGVGIGLAFIQIIGIVFACVLARAIDKQNGYDVV